MEDGITSEDFLKDFKKSYAIHVNENGICICRIHKGQASQVFFDVAFCVLAVEVADHLQWFRFYHFVGARPVFDGEPRLTLLRFASHPVVGFFAEVDGRPLNPNRISRLNFYARTDRGTIVFSLMPTFARYSRTLASAEISNSDPVNPLVNQFAVEWLNDIVKIKN